MKLNSVKKSGNGFLVNIENVGGFPAPFDLIIKYTDGSKETLHQTPGLWEKNSETASVQVDTKKTIAFVNIDGGIFMDATTGDNSWNAK